MDNRNQPESLDAMSVKPLAMKLLGNDIGRESRSQSQQRLRQYKADGIDVTPIVVVNNDDDDND